MNNVVREFIEDMDGIGCVLLFSYPLIFILGMLVGGCAHFFLAH